jgi:hypothetical protein
MCCSECVRQSCLRSLSAFSHRAVLVHCASQYYGSCDSAQNQTCPTAFRARVALLPMITVVICRLPVTPWIQRSHFSVACKIPLPGHLDCDSSLHRCETRPQALVSDMLVENFRRINFCPPSLLMLTSSRNRAVLADTIVSTWCRNSYGKPSRSSMTELLLALVISRISESRKSGFSH